MATTLVTTYTGGIDSAFSHPFFYLVQDDISGMTSMPTADDLAAILNFVLAGRSAREYNSGNCPIRFAENRIYLDLDIFVHTSSATGQYSLTPTVLSEISDPIEEHNEDDQHLIVKMSDYLDLERNVTGILDFDFITACYNENGTLIPVPDYIIVGSRIVFTEKIFAVVRVRYNYIAYRHTITTIAEYTPETEAIDSQTGETKTLQQLAAEGVYGYINVDWTNVITATHINENGEEGIVSLTLEVPSCVDNMLGTCVYAAGGGGSVDVNPPKDTTGKITVYYDNCDGTFLRAEFP